MRFHRNLFVHDDPVPTTAHNHRYLDETARAGVVFTVFALDLGWGNRVHVIMGQVGQIGPQVASRVRRACQREATARLPMGREG